MMTDPYTTFYLVQRYIKEYIVEKNDMRPLKYKNFHQVQVGAHTSVSFMIEYELDQARRLHQVAG
jgi:hypothetical protein